MFDINDYIPDGVTVETGRLEKVYKFKSKITGEIAEIPLLSDDIIVDGELRRIVRDETGNIPDWAKKTSHSVDSVRITPEGICYTKMGELAKLTDGRSLKAYINGSTKLFRVTKLIAYTFGYTIEDTESKFSKFDCINDLPKGESCNSKAYAIWRHLYYRCYSYKHKCYEGCSVCKEWKYASRFKEWYSNNIYNTKSKSTIHIDKDIIHKGNKVYEPKTCLIVPSYINGYFIGINKDTSVGVIDLKNGRYRAFCYTFLTSTRKYLGTYKSHEKAHQAWAEFKTKQLHEVVLPYYINDVAESDRNNPMVLKVIEILKNYKFE